MTMRTKIGDPLSDQQIIMGGAKPARGDRIGEEALEKTIFKVKRKVKGYHCRRGAREHAAGDRLCPDCQRTKLSKYTQGRYCFACTNRRFMEKRGRNED